MKKITTFIFLQYNMLNIALIALIFLVVFFQQFNNPNDDLKIDGNTRFDRNSISKNDAKANNDLKADHDKKIISN